jgi:hypothetical protein
MGDELGKRRLVMAVVDLGDVGAKVRKKTRSRIHDLGWVQKKFAGVGESSSPFSLRAMNLFNCGGRIHIGTKLLAHQLRTV